MSHLREKYSVLEGFIPNSLVEAGKEYHAYDLQNPDVKPERVFIDAIYENGSDHFDVQLTYEADRSTDFWHLSPGENIFKNYVEEIKEEIKGVQILNIKKKSLNEGKKGYKEYKVPMKKESKIQIGDDVIYNRQRANVIGAIGEKWIVQCQYSTYTVESKDLTNMKARREIYGSDQFKFDDKTQKLLFEQMVRCGIYMGNTPVQLYGCHVKYSEWNTAKDSDKIRVLVENATQFFPKQQIRILEDINDFANPDNFIEGVIIDESTGEAMENVMINVEDYTAANGDAEMVRVLRKVDEESKLETIPKALLKTLAV